MENAFAQVAQIGSTPAQFPSPNGAAVGRYLDHLPPHSTHQTQAKGLKALPIPLRHGFPGVSGQRATPTSQGQARGQPAGAPSIRLTSTTGCGAPDPGRGLCLEISPSPHLELISNRSFSGGLFFNCPTAPPSTGGGRVRIEAYSVRPQPGNGLRRTHTVQSPQPAARGTTKTPRWAVISTTAPARLLSLQQDASGRELRGEAGELVPSQALSRTLSRLLKSLSLSLSLSLLRYLVCTVSIHSLSLLRQLVHEPNYQRSVNPGFRPRKSRRSPLPRQKVDETLG